MNCERQKNIQHVYCGSIWKLWQKSFDLKTQQKVGWHHWHQFKNTCISLSHWVSTVDSGNMIGWMHEGGGSHFKNTAREARSEAKLLGEVSGHPNVVALLLGSELAEFLYLFGIEMVVRDGKPRPCWQHKHAIGKFFRWGFRRYPPFVKGATTPNL